MGKCVDRLPHSCGTRKGLQVYVSDDGSKVDGYCHACDTYVQHPYGEERSPDQIEVKKGKTEEEIQALLAEIDGYQTVDLPKRKLRAADLDEFGVKVALNENDGKTPDEVYYPYRVEGKITGYKVKLVAVKQMWSVGKLKDVDLFGWDEAVKSGAKRLIIFEGEDDAIAAKKVLKRFTKAEYIDNIPACVSLPHGAASAHKDLAKLAKKLRRHFKEIVLCFDKDKAGEEATEKVLKILDDALTVELPEKDANDCLIKGFGQAMFKALTFNAQRKKNSRIILGEDIADAAMAPATFGQLTWPWNHINDVTRGIRYGETYFLGAGV